MPLSEQTAHQTNVKDNVSTPHEDGGIDFVGMLMMLWRLKGIIISVAALIFIIGMAIMLTVKPRYTAVAMISVGQPPAQILNVDSVLQGVPMDALRIGTEVQILQSRSLAERVVTRLGLMSDPEFNPKIRVEEESWIGALNLLSWLPSSNDDQFASLSAEEILQRERAVVVNNVMKTINADQAGLSYIINVGVGAESAITARNIVNAVADEYLVSQMEVKFGATERATKWLNERIAELREGVEASERAVEEYRAQLGLINGEENASLTNQQISQVNAQLIIARTEEAAARARLRQVEQLVARGIEGGENLESPQIQTLRARSADLARQVAELSQEYGERHPRMISLRAEIADTEVQIAAEVQNILQRFRNETDIAVSRRATLEISLNELKDAVVQQNQGAVQLRTLEREAGARRALHETFLNRFQETSVQEDLQQADAEVIAYAELPTQPSYPQKLPFTLVTLFLAIIGGTSVAFIAHLALDRGIRTTDMLETTTGLPCLVALPELTGGKDPVAYAVEHPKSQFGEALRSLHTNIELSAIDDDPKVIVFTSAVPGEGKSSVSAAYAALMAQSGRRVLLVDGDLRRSRVHEIFSEEQSPGIVDLLAETAESPQVIRVVEETGLHIIPSGTKVVSPQDVLGSEGMKEFLAWARQHYDLVVVDTPPVNVVSETLHLASEADRVILLVKWSTTHRDIVVQARRHLDDANARYAGAVLSQVGPKADSGYSYSGYSGYGRAYTSYYHEG